MKENENFNNRINETGAKACIDLEKSGYFI